MPKFVFDPAKAFANRKKHGVSFEEATSAFFDSLNVSFPDHDHSTDESRFIMLGQSTQSRLLYISYTEADSTVRLISARVATANERKQYEEDL